MARAGRKRKIDAPRFPNGQVKPGEQEPSPTLVKRLAAYSLAGMQSQQWGAIAGVYYLSKKIDDIEYDAARRFGDLYSQYMAIMGGPRSPKSSSAERVSNFNHVDVDTEAGNAELQRHIILMERYSNAQNALSIFEQSVRSDLIRFCSMPGETPSNYDNFLKMKNALKALANLWKIDHK